MNVSTRYFFCPQHANLTTSEKIAKIRNGANTTLIADQKIGDDVTDNGDTNDNGRKNYDIGQFFNGNEEEIDERLLLIHNMGLVEESDGGSEDEDEEKSDVIENLSHTSNDERFLIGKESVV